VGSDFPALEKQKNPNTKVRKKRGKGLKKPKTEEEKKEKLGSHAIRGLRLRRESPEIGKIP